MQYFNKITELTQEATTLYRPYPLTPKKLQIKSYLAFQLSKHPQTKERGYTMALDNIEDGKKYIQ